MRTVLFAVIALTSCLHCEAAVSVPKCPREYAGLKVQIEMRGAIFPHGQRIPVVVTLYNGSADTVRLSPYMETSSYWLDFEIFGPAGQKIPWMGTEFKIIDDGSRMSLKPGYFWGRRIDDLRASYDLATTGQYRIRAIYGVSPVGKCSSGSIVSESVSFEVK